MTTALTRPTLESDLVQAQQGQDWTEQVRILFALAEVATVDEEYSIAQGFYGQAWAAAERAGDQSSVLRAMRSIGQAQQHMRLRGEDSIDLTLWFEQVLTLSLERRDYVNQAEIYMLLGPLARDRTQMNDLYLLAYACYDLSGHIPDSAYTPMSLSDQYRYTLRNMRVQERKTAALNRYQQLEDRECEAHILLAYGETALWAKDYDSARQDLDNARHLFQEIGDHKRLKYVLLRLMRLAHRIHDYDLYLECHAQVIASFIPRPKTDEVLTLWLELAVIAADHHDWVTARRAYQGALMVAVSLDMTRQGRIYWQWGQMEYHKGRRSMGIALCQWGVALIQHYLPDQDANYQRELKQMRKENAQ